MKNFIDCNNKPNISTNKNGEQKVEERKKIDKQNIKRKSFLTTVVFPIGGGLCISLCPGHEQEVVYIQYIYI